MPGQLTSITNPPYLRILHLTNNTISENKAYAIIQLIKRQVANGVKPVLIAMGQNAPLVAFLDQDDIQFISLNKSSPRTFWRHWAAIERVIRLYNINVIHAHDITSGIYSAMARIRNRVPVVLNRRDLSRQIILGPAFCERLFHK